MVNVSLFADQLSEAAAQHQPVWRRQQTQKERTGTVGQVRVGKGSSRRATRMSPLLPSTRARNSVSMPLDSLWRPVIRWSMVVFNVFRLSRITRIWRVNLPPPTVLVRCQEEGYRSDCWRRSRAISLKGVPDHELVHNDGVGRKGSKVMQLLKVNGLRNKSMREQRKSTQI